MKFSDIKFVLSNTGITVFMEGKQYASSKSDANYPALRKALIDEDIEAVKKNLTVEKTISSWANGKFKMEGDKVYFNGEELPDGISERIKNLARSGEDVLPFLNFWERLSKNPSHRSISQLPDFLKHSNIPFTKEGRFLAYKAVNEDFTDVHTGKISNAVGAVNKMPRNKISDDPREACHYGFHVGALEYATSFGSYRSRMVVCEIDPEHVVCVPYDSSQQKMRVCEYKVIGLHGAPMSSTNMDEDDMPQEDDSDQPEVDEVSDAPDVALPKKGKKEPEKKSSKKKAPPPPPKLSAKWKKFRSMTMLNLMEESLDILRKYAAEDLKIVGASKIPGGKTALVAAILKARV